MNAPLRQREPRYENRKLLDLAHGMPCFATFPHACNEAQGCHPAHANWSQFGKGVGTKAHDWAFASMCGNAHRMIDGEINATMDRDTRFSEWLNAFISTQDWLWREKKVRVA